VLAKRHHAIRTGALAGLIGKRSHSPAIEGPMRYSHSLTISCLGPPPTSGEPAPSSARPSRVAERGCLAFVDVRTALQCANLLHRKRLRWWFSDGFGQPIRAKPGRIFGSFRVIHEI
jgi:hypothetical protein